MAAVLLAVFAVVLAAWLSVAPWPALPAGVATGDPAFVAGIRVLIGSCHKVSCDADGGSSITNFPGVVSPDSPSPAKGCVAPSEYGHTWPAILERAEGASAWVWAGDAVYADLRQTLFSAYSRGLLFKEAPGSWKLNPFEGASPARIAAHLGYLKSQPQYTELRAKVPTVLGMYDDHDFGLNDGGANYEHAAASAQLFLDFLEEPKDSPRRQRPGGGIWSAHTVGGSIRVVLLDVRTNREPYGTVDGDFLGEDQWEWLGTELLSLSREDSDVKATVLVSPLPILADRFGFGEGWHQFPTARERLYRLLHKTAPPGLVMVSGDIHLAESNLALCGHHHSTGGGGGGRVPLAELTTSGLTHAWRRAHTWGVPTGPYQLLRLAQAVLPFYYQTEPVYDDLNFGEIALSVDEKTIRLAAISANNEVVLSTTLPVVPFGSGLEEEQGSGDDGPGAFSCQPWRGPASTLQGVVGLGVVFGTGFAPIFLGLALLRLLGQAALRVLRPE